MLALWPFDLPRFRHEEETFHTDLKFRQSPIFFLFLCIWSLWCIKPSLRLLTLIRSHKDAISWPQNGIASHACHIDAKFKHFRDILWSSILELQLLIMGQQPSSDISTFSVERKFNEWTKKICGGNDCHCTRPSVWISFVISGFLHGK